MTKRFTAGLAALVLVCAGFGGANAAGPSNFVDALGEQFIGALQTTPDTTERREQLRVIFDQALDYETIAKYALGRHWDATGPDQRSAYVDVFRGYLLEIYTVQLGRYLGQTYRIVEEKQVSDALTLVSVEVEQPDDDAFMVDFRVGANGDGFKVVDVAVDGVSLIVAKRSEFGAVVRREGVEGLIDRLRQVTERVS